MVLDKGKIIEEGTHQKLVEKDGFYHHLYKMQFKDPFKKEKLDVFDDFQLLDESKDTFDDKERFPRFF